MDEDLPEIAHQAADEADSLVRLLGVTPSTLHRRIGQSQATTALPGIDAWYKSEERTGEFDFEEDGGFDENEYDGEAEELHHTIAAAEDPKISRTHRQDQKLLNLACALVAVAVDDLVKVYVLVSFSFLESHSEKITVIHCPRLRMTRGTRYWPKTGVISRMRASFG